MAREWCPNGNPWTPGQDAYLCEHWEDQTDEEMAAAVGHPVSSTRARRLKLELRTRESSKGPDWTEEEIELMEDLWGTYTIPQIAKRLNRSVQAVKVKSTRLGLGRYVNSSQYLTANQVANLMHVDIHAVTDVWIPAGLPFKYIGQVFMQKTYTPDFLTGKQVKNDGKLEMYLVENAHEAIIDRETFDKVQKMKGNIKGNKKRL